MKAVSHEPRAMSMKLVVAILILVALAGAITGCAATKGSVTTGPCRWEGGLNGGLELKGSLVCEAEVLGEVQRLLEMQCSGFSPFANMFAKPGSLEPGANTPEPAPEPTHHVH